MSQYYSSYSDWFTKVWILADLPYRFKPFDIFSAEQLVTMYNDGVSPKTVAKKMRYGLDKKVGSIVKIANTDLNSSLIRTKFKSEIVRTLFFIAMGYSFPNPWGIAARPIYPERTPLPIKDKNAGKEPREAIEKLINGSKYDGWIRQLLRDIKDGLVVKPSKKRTK